MATTRQRPVPGCNRGFTMIELMVVLVVVGLLVSLVGLSMGGGGERRELEEQTRTLYLKMQAAADEAVLRNAEIGFDMRESRYRFSTYDPDEDLWRARQDRRLPPGQMPDWLAVDIRTEGAEGDLPVDDDADIIPDIVFFSSGEITPFDMELRVDGQPDSAHYLISDGINPLEWYRPGDDEPIRR